MNKFIWIFGAISGILGSVAEYMVYGNYMPYDSFVGIRLFKIFILVICIVFAVIALKKLNGQISLARTLLTSILVSLVRSIFLIGGFLLMHYPNGEIFEPVKAYAFEKVVAMMEEEDRTPKNLAEKKLEIADQFSLTGYPKYGLMGSAVTAVFVGVFLGLIVANKSKNS